MDITERHRCSSSVKPAVNDRGIVGLSDVLSRPLSVPTVVMQAGSRVGTFGSALGATRAQPMCCRVAVEDDHYRLGIATGEQLAMWHTTSRTGQKQDALESPTAIGLGVWDSAVWLDEQLLLLLARSQRSGTALEDIMDCVRSVQSITDGDRIRNFSSGFYSSYASTRCLDTRSAERLARALRLSDKASPSRGSDLGEYQRAQRASLALSEEAAVQEAIRNGDTSAPWGAVTRLEQRCCDYLGVRHALAHCNGTSAMFSAMHAVGVTRGKTVLCPTYTWWASASPALWLGARVAFFDVAEDLRPDLNVIESLCTKDTAAIVIPHLWGNYVSVEQVRERLAPHVAVIEDASHAFGAWGSEGFLGTSGDVGVFSLQARKPLAAGEGGMMVTNSDRLHERAISVGHYERLPGSDPLRRTAMGLKFRMSPLNAALALARLPTLPLRSLRQAAADEIVLGQLRTVPEVTIIGRDAWCPLGGRTGSRLTLTRELAGRAIEVCKSLQAVGIIADPDYMPMLHREPLFSEGIGIGGTAATRSSCPTADTLVDSIISIGIDPMLPAGELVDYANRITEVIGHALSAA